MAYLHPNNWGTPVSGTVEERVWKAIQDRVGLTASNLDDAFYQKHKIAFGCHNKLRSNLAKLEAKNLVIKHKIKRKYYYSDKTAFGRDTKEARAFRVKLARYDKLQTVRDEIDRYMSRHGFNDAVKIHGDDIQVDMSLELAEEWLNLIKMKL